MKGSLEEYLNRQETPVLLAALREYERKESLADFEKKTAEALKARAIENGLLEKAKRNAETIITSLLSVSLDSDQEYKIEFVYTEAQ